LVRDLTGSYQPVLFAAAGFTALLSLFILTVQKPDKKS